MKTPNPDSNPSRPWASSLLRKACGLLALPLFAAWSVPSASAYTVPNTSDLLFSANTDSLPASGNTGNWAATTPAAGIFNTIGTPTVDSVGTTPVKWEKNVAYGTGYYNTWTWTSPVAVNGVSAVAVVKPVRIATNLRGWTPVIDVLFGAFRLGVLNDTGVVILTRSNPSGTQTQVNSSTAIPDGQSTVLSAVVQPDGSYQVWANGTSIMTGTALTGGVTSLVNGARRLVCVGCSQDDTSATLNGDIGDVLMWKVALAPADRTALENDLMAKFHAGASYPANTITASSTGTGGTISPTGSATVQYEADKTYTITSSFGYSVDVVVDGVSQGSIGSYTFNDVVAAHTIAANYTLRPTRTISGTVTAATGGAPVSGATVSVRYTSGAMASQTATSDASGNYTMTVPTGTYYVCASKTAYLISAESATNATGDQTINFSLAQKLHLNGAVRNIPQMENLLFAADTNDMGAVGTQGNWPTLYCTYPGISTLTAIVSPLVQKQRGLKYDYNLRADNDGYRLNTASVQNSIPTSGASVV